LALPVLVRSGEHSWSVAARRALTAQTAPAWGRWRCRRAWQA
jgi:hypothetical protein